MGRKKLGEVAAVGSTDCFCFLCCLRSVAVIFLEMILDIYLGLCVFQHIQKEGKIYIIFIDVFSTYTYTCVYEYLFENPGLQRIVNLNCSQRTKIKF